MYLSLKYLPLKEISLLPEAHSLRNAVSGCRLEGYDVWLLTQLRVQKKQVLTFFLKFFSTLFLYTEDLLYCKSELTRPLCYL